MISIPVYILTIVAVVLGTIFFIYFFNRIKKDNIKKAEIIHVPEAYDQLWVEIDKRHRILRSHYMQNKNPILLQNTIEEYEALLTKYKYKIYELGETIRDEGSKEIKEM